MSSTPDPTSKDPFMTRVKTYFSGFRIRAFDRLFRMTRHGKVEVYVKSRRSWVAAPLQKALKVWSLVIEEFGITPAPTKESQS